MKDSICKSSNKDVRAAAIHRIGKSGDERAKEFLRQVLSK
jgi:HEAT repeat protein